MISLRLASVSADKGSLLAKADFSKLVFKPADVLLQGVHKQFGVFWGHDN